MKIRTDLFRLFEVILCCFVFYKWLYLPSILEISAERPTQLCHKQNLGEKADLTFISAIPDLGHPMQLLDSMSNSERLHTATSGFTYNQSGKQVTSGPLLVWVDGHPRSGTTLMRVLLDAHPDINCGPETNIFLNTLNFLRSKIDSKVRVYRIFVIKRQIILIK